MRLAFLSLACLLAPLAMAADWPHIRGQHFNASSSELCLAEHWTTDGPPILWTRELGPGYSGFAVADGRVYTLFQIKTGMVLIALDADTGAEVWQVRVDWPWQPGGMYPGPYASPTYHEGHVYYATPSGKVGCVTATDGREKWSLDVRAKFGGRGTEFGFASTPLVEDGRVILPVGGANASLVALNATDGATLWTSGNDQASYTPAFPITLDGRRLVVGFLQNALVIHDPATGKRLWRERLSDSYDEHAAWPLFDGRHLLIASPFRNGAKSFHLTATPDGVTGKQLWAGKQLSNDVCSSLLVDGHVYGFDLHQSQASTHRPSRGIFKCLELTNGKVRWESDQIGQATALYADRKLILWTESGTLILARASPERYEELARTQILSGGGMCWAAPAISGKRLYVRDHQRAACIYLGPQSDLDPARPKVTITHEAPLFDWSRLVPREPEFPHDVPTTSDVGAWFIWCLGLLSTAALCTWIIHICMRCWNVYGIYAVVAFLLGTIGTTAIGAWADLFVLTWPISLYVAFRGVLWLGASRTLQDWRSRLIARLGLIMFAILCYGYYRLCLVVGFAMAWGYLIGFLPAAPFAIVAAKSTRLRVWLLCEFIGFAIYFWVSGLIPGWKVAWVG